MSTPVIFDIYRYQILPISNNVQLSIDSTFASIEELIEQKNKILKRTLIDKRIIFDGRKSRVIHRIDEQTDDIFLMQIGSEKKIQIIQEDFSIDKVPSYPNTHVIFYNDPQNQLCLVQHSYNAFAQTETVINIIERNLNRYLGRQNLRVYFKPLFNEYDFWKLIDEYEGRVEKIRFEFIRHNLANISKSLPEAFKRLQTDLNSHKALLQTDASKNGVLEVNKNNNELNGLVDYSKNGGGDIGVKVKGLRAIIKTSKSKKKIEIDEAIFQSTEELTKFIKDLDGNL